jgi:hypothetical protein
MCFFATRAHRQHRNMAAVLLFICCCVQIIVRKVYHLLAGGLFVPVFFWDLPLLCLSLAIAFAALQLLEVVRHLRLPRIGAAVQQFMQVCTLIDPASAT